VAETEGEGDGVDIGVGVSRAVADAGGVNDLRLVAVGATDDRALRDAV
jgi:hypothetical protein